ncbi:MAG: hypothetical protein HY875_14290 [Chloroflexi bacterium]|nr:hypothetical protein [Chloroflexota bacterium]
MAVTQLRPRPHLYDPGWTPRQRQVLDLLARGRTNPQIGEALGISLDGAKWHVSEVITKLGVDSREEAAEYWRQYNGLPARLHRVFAGVASMAGLKWAATAVGVVVLAAAIAVGAAIFANLRDGEGDNEAAAPGDVDTTAPTPGAGGTTTPSPGGQGGALSLGGSATLPANLAFYYFSAPPQSDAGYDGRIIRAYRDAAGTLHKDDVFAFFSARGEKPHDYAFDSRMGEIVAAVCQQPPACTQVGPALASARATVYHSLDGGVTWAEYGEVTGAGSFIAVFPGGALRATPVQEASGGQSVRYSLFPSGVEVLPPAGDYSLYPYNVPGLGLTWTNAKGVVYDAMGQEVLRLQLDTSAVTAPKLLGFSNGELTASWRRQSELIIGTFASDGTLKTSYTWAANQDLQPVRLAGVNTVAGSVQTESSNNAMHGAIIDLATNTIRPLPDLDDRSSTFTVSTVAGPFLRVTSAGDCLNVREQPSTSAAVVGCYADNVVFKDGGESKQADGKTWLAVETPTGKPGWAVADYLSR